MGHLCHCVLLENWTNLSFQRPPILCWSVRAFVLPTAVLWGSVEMFYPFLQKRSCRKSHAHILKLNEGGLESGGQSRSRWMLSGILEEVRRCVAQVTMICHPRQNLAQHQNLWLTGSVVRARCQSPSNLPLLPHSSGVIRIVVTAELRSSSCLFIERCTTQL